MATANYKSIASKLKFEGRAYINGKYVDAITIWIKQTFCFDVAEMKKLQQLILNLKTKLVLLI